MNKTNKEKGNIGEDLATKYLIEQSYTIIHRNYNTRVGEVDIIARQGNEVAFIEVKYRTKGNEDDAMQSITKSKQKKVIKAALQFIASCEDAELLCYRFDVIIIIQEKDRHFQLNHYKDAFRYEPNY
ncbi:MAG: YraN family protein [Candidatus Cloacimonadales bacterium]|jgi:putative endonuclease|nr:YraN family protein [Candidatus Cloacimonadota bacterium]MDD2650650.1 YraN family protein [Candidatus Cloacimonadota bacterium]MDD3502431.1 YraN family protein [Candidatus Cloacimonadota bacterium]MDX9978297.1 YraN family protein [Candidatus Cloacimonadales bacterium]